MKIAYRIMGCYDRKAMIDAEVAKLSGLDVKVFYDDRPDAERKGTWYTQMSCINDVLDKDYTHLVLLQDDILLVNDFGKCIDRLVDARPMVLWTLFCPRIPAEDLNFSSPYAMIFPANTWGQGNIIPIPMLRKIVAFRQEKMPNYLYDDGLYLMYLVENGMPCFTTKVALMQHLCPTDSKLGYNNKKKVTKLWAGENVYNKINWGSKEFRKYNIPSGVDFAAEYARYGPKKFVKPRYIMRTVGNVDLSEYQEAIPTLEIAKDRKHDAMDTFKLSLEMAGDDPCVHLEDDIILCDNFVERIELEIAKRPDDVIQFFSMRKDDLTIGSRYINGSLFCMNQCYYIPAGMGTKLLAYMDVWDRYEEEPNAYDYLMADFFKLHRIKYWNVCPNLVDHKVQKSRINARRSSKRQSFTFGK